MLLLQCVVVDVCSVLLLQCVVVVVDVVYIDIEEIQSDHHPNEVVLFVLLSCVIVSTPIKHNTTQHNTIPLTHLHSVH